MLKLNEDLEFKMNHFHGSYMDFIYKVNEVFEYNNLNTSHFIKSACRCFDKQGGSRTISGRNGLEAQFKLNNDLFYIAFLMINEVNAHDKHLEYHLKSVIKKIYVRLSDELIGENYYNPSYLLSNYMMKTSKSDES